MSSVGRARALSEFTIDLGLDPSDREELQFRFGFSGSRLLADLKFPFPDVRDRRHRNRELYALVGHHALDLRRFRCTSRTVLRYRSRRRRG